METNGADVTYRATQRRVCRAAGVQVTEANRHDAAGARCPEDNTAGGGGCGAVRADVRKATAAALKHRAT